MPNLYATPSELKAAMADVYQPGNTDYDALMLTLLNQASREVDRHCKRSFYPAYAARSYSVRKSSDELWVDDLIEIDTVEISDDDGETYDTLAATDYYATVAGDLNSARSYSLLIMDPNGTEGLWPAGQKSVRITGWWACADDRDEVWENSQDTVENNPLAADGVSITVNDADGADQWGVTPRFQAGQLARIEDEAVEITVVTAGITNTLTVARGRNGSTAAVHIQNTEIKIFRAPEMVKRATIVVAGVMLGRGKAGFGDGTANVELGRVFFVKEFPAEVRKMLEMYKKVTV